MLTRRLVPDGEGLAIAVEVVLRGGTVAFPTDTVYGIGARADDVAAVLRLYRAKDRPGEKAIPLLLSSTELLPTVAREIPPVTWRLAEEFWPGGLTIVLRKQPGVLDAVSAGDTVAVRVPDHPVALALLRGAALPVAATSANISGGVSPTSAQEVWRDLAGRIDLLLDGGACPGGVPSTVLDLSGDVPRLVRPGAVPAARIALVAGRPLQD